MRKWLIGAVVSLAILMTCSAPAQAAPAVICPTALGKVIDCPRIRVTATVRVTVPGPRITVPGPRVTVKGPVVYRTVTKPVYRTQHVYKTVTHPVYRTVTKPVYRKHKVYRYVTRTQTAHETAVVNRTKTVAMAPKTEYKTKTQVPHPQTTESTIKKHTAHKQVHRRKATTHPQPSMTTKTVVKESVVQVTKTKAYAVSAGLVAGGILIGLLTMYIFYVLGYLASDAQERKSLKKLFKDTR